MKTEAVKAGYYETEFGKYPKIQILTIKELFEGKKPSIPLVDPTAFKKAKAEPGKQERLIYRPSYHNSNFGRRGRPWILRTRDTMPTTTTRTLNPLPFNVLEPKRFEDLVRQLVYDFRRWRMLEATGRTGSDEGFDARGFEITTDDDVGIDEGAQDGDDEPIPDRTADRIWLIQCKRERVIGPAKMRQYLDEIADDEARGLYGIIFAAACDFSKATRDELHKWCRTRGISEAHVWSKGEIEDQLFQPKNDHLLFAYFGISLQIRRRSARTSLRSMMTMKRKVMRHLGDKEDETKTVLLRDPEDEYYPLLGEGARENYHWSVSTFAGNDTGRLKIEWRRFYAFLDQDGIHWDCANIQNDSRMVDFEDAWLTQNERDERRRLNHEIHDFWYNQLPEDQQATYIVHGFFKYDEILEIDEKGDNAAPFPHVYVPFKDGKPAFSYVSGRLTVAGLRTGPNGKPLMTAPRRLYNPLLEHRIEKFPARFRVAARPSAYSIN
jgi:hypothetical protein